ncbi:uncharacterized protein [Henckelia pumila]|uniref:uncharacterized protein n=1 Tax=Henckelia pumila TaxID=405737 RepID=UPI003C6E73DF
MSRALKRLPIQGQRLAAVSPLPPAPLTLPESSLSLSELTPTSSSTQAQIIQLTTLFKTHLKENPTTLSTNELVHFMKTRLRHHPTLSHLDFYLFRYTATLDSFRHDHSTFEYMARSLVYSHRLDSLLSLLEFIATNPCPCADGIFSCPKIEAIFRVSIGAFCRSGKFENALFAFDTMKRLIDGKPDVALYNIVIHGFLKFGKLDKGVEFYGRMIRDMVNPDVVTFNTLISGYCKSNKFALALDVFQEMKDKGCLPNVVCFNTLIKGFFQDGKTEEAIGMAHEMIDFGCKFSCATCEILIDGLCRQEKIVEASVLMIDFLRKGVLPHGFDYLVLIERLCKAGNAGRAYELVDELWGQGYAPSLFSFTTLIEGLCGVGRTDESVKLVRKMLKENIVPDTVTFNSLLSHLCDSRQTAEANKLRLLASDKGLHQDGMMYRILISGYSKEGRREEGEAVVNEMLDRGFVPNIATYNRFMGGLAKAK